MQEKIVRLAEAMPKVDFQGYFGQVSSFTGYQFRVGIYAAPDPGLDKADPRASDLLSIKYEMEDVLVKAKVTESSFDKDAWYHTRFGSTDHLGSSGMFFGEKPQTFKEDYGFLKLRVRERTLVEPQEVGIGIHLKKEKTTETAGKSYERRGCHCGKGGHDGSVAGTWHTTIAENVFVRIVDPEKVIVTYDREQGEVGIKHGLSQLDDILERAVKKPIIKSESYFEEAPDDRYEGYG